MAVSFHENFECPPGYQEEEVDGQLYHEDLDEDSELWLIRMPSDIELSAVDKKKIFLSGSRNPTTYEAENGKVLDFFVEEHEMPDICLVLPQRSDKKLHEVKKVFKGSILISEGMPQSDNTVVKCEPAEDAHTADENLNISNRNHERGKKKRSRTGNKELVYSNSQQGDTEIKNELSSSDLDELRCHSQK